MPDTRTGALEASASVSTGFTPITTRLETDAGLDGCTARRTADCATGSVAVKLPSAPVVTVASVVSAPSPLTLWIWSGAPAIAAAGGGRVCA